ncbi:alpha/beta hydrolase family protein [Actinophytocola gossypii]|uniref:alpha/beta hydrolase family protein n=1 Tax=Actinophytocola gossypii TaxID=2812003 RepID=UPI0021A843C8|nr:alpha/beta hydrolase [Actinophytocola gossypii]
MPHLPDPTGRHEVGVTSVYLNDTSRPDPWMSDVDSRELMVSLFYPTASTAGPVKKYLTPAESRALLADGGITTVPPDALSTVRTNAVVDARPSGRPRSRPLVVLSPGFKKPRATLSSIAEDLASHGYVVAVVDHTYENVVTTFPDGRVTDCAACGQYDLPFWRKLSRGRAADVSFVLDELTGPHPRWRGAHLIDPRHIAMGGHSVGGASTIDAMLADHRIRAGVDIDGTLDAPIPDSGLDRPFMFLGRANTYTPGTPGGAAESWEQSWPRLTGWRRWLVVAGMEHASFTDIGVLAEQFGLDLGADTGGDRGAAITRRYVRAFFDLHLRGERQPLLERPSSRFPEVSVVG